MRLFSAIGACGHLQPQALLYPSVLLGRKGQCNEKQRSKETQANELTREMLEELVKEIRVSGKDTLEIKWNFKDFISENDEENQ